MKLPTQCNQWHAHNMCLLVSVFERKNRMFPDIERLSCRSFNDKDDYSPDVAVHSECSPMSIIYQRIKNQHIVSI